MDFEGYVVFLIMYGGGGGLLHRLIIEKPFLNRSLIRNSPSAKNTHRRDTISNKNLTFETLNFPGEEKYYANNLILSPTLKYKKNKY